MRIPMHATRYIATLAVLLAGAGSLRAQCPELYDYYGVPSANPTWYHCSGTNFTLLVATPNTVGNFTVDWGDGSPLHVGASLQPPQTVAHVYTGGVAQYTVTFTELATGCVVSGTLVMEQSTSASIQIPVGGLTQVCAPHPVDFINSSTNVSPNTVFTWDFGDGSAPLVFDHTNWMQTITHMYLQGTVDCETVVTLTAANTCNQLQGGPSVATFNPIRIWDLDDAQITPSATLLCWPDNEVTFLNTTERNCLMQGNIFQRFEHWNFGDYWGTGQDSIIDWTAWPPTFPRTIEYPGIGTYEVVMMDSNYCGIDTARITINIVPPPEVTLAVYPDTICAGETVQFTQTVSGGANYFQWDFGQGGGWQWTGAGNQSRTYNAPGTYDVGFTASIEGATPGCADTAWVQVVVLPSPTAQFTLDDDAACDSLTVAFTNTSFGGSQHSWDFGDGTASNVASPPPHFYGSPGSYAVSLTVTNGQGCTATANELVNIYEPPLVQIGAQNVCEGSIAQFADLTSLPPGNQAISWAWDLGDGTTSDLQSPQHLYAGGGSYDVTLTVTTAHCSGTGQQQVTVEPGPQASFAPSTTLGCSPLVVQFTNNSVGAVSHVWTFGDGGASNEVAPTHTFLNLTSQDTTYVVQLVVSTSFGCTDTVQVPITVAPGIQAMFTHDAMPGCAPLDVNFTNNSTGATDFLWDFGDGSSSTEVSPSHQYINDTQVLQMNTVTLTASSAAGCQAVATQQIIVYPMPDFVFTAQPDSGCSPLSVTFPGVLGAVAFQWDFGDGATGSGPSPTHVYLNNTGSAQQFPVTLVATNAFGCTGTAQDLVTVFPNPQASFTVGTPAGCHPLTADLVNTSQGADSFSWTYGDGSMSDTAAVMHAHTWFNFPGPGAQSYPIGLTATNIHGCSSTATGQVQVYPEVTAGIVAQGIGCSPLTVDFVSTSTGATDHVWSFGDGGVGLGTNPSHTYVNQGLADVTYTATLTATSTFGCTDTASTPITVHPAPIAQFIPSTQAGCQPLQVTFQDLTIGAVSNTWNFGDGSLVTAAPGNAMHTYANTTGTLQLMDVELVATSADGCMDTAQAQIQVYPQVIATFELDSVGCSPLNIAPLLTGTGGQTYLWDMGDGNVLTGPQPTYTYVNTGNAPITRTITLTVTSPFGCVAQAVRSVTIHPVPTAAFLATPFIQQFPDATVDITNTTVPGNWSFQWSFGDGGTSLLQHPGSHTYATWGQYGIMLVVTSAMCSDTLTQAITIEPPHPTASFIGQGDGCAPLTVSFTNTSLQALSYQWNFGDGGTSTADNPIYVYNVPGTYTVTLTAFGVGGSVNTMVKVDSVVVRPRANAFFVLQPTNVVIPTEPVYVYNLSGNATEFLWNMGDGTTYTSFNPVHHYTSPGQFDVQLIANNEWNCPDTFLLEGAVTAEPSGDIQFPNAFTPGTGGPTDGLYDPLSFSNDHFFPIQEGVEDYHLQVFNRWGELVFESHDVRRGWDGYYRGSPAKQDVYVWKAYARFSDGNEKTLSGDVTLLR